MTDEPESFDLSSDDVAARKRAELKRLYPEVFTEDQIDFDQLRRVMGDWVDPGPERFGLTWPGKAACMRVIQAPATGTLRPDREESVNFDETDNVFIEGDNLEVLKLLQKAYFGKVKMIYIDPPYNTGKEFIYPDRYAENLDTYLEYTGQKDAEGRTFSTNTDSSGRFHSRWLNMMYPRLYLAKNLLRDDGVIFISIGEDEVVNLRRICSEIFGEENFIASFMWEKSRKNDAKLVSSGHDYVLVFVKSAELLREKKIKWREEKPGAREIWNHYLSLREQFGKDDEAISDALQNWFSELPKGNPSKKWSRYKRVDENGPWRDYDITWPGGGGPRYDVIHPKTGLPCEVPERGWIFPELATMQKYIDAKIVTFRDDHTEPPLRKLHLRPVDVDDLDDDGEQTVEDDLATQVRGTYFYKQSQVTVRYLRDLMGGKVFDNPKDHEELGRFIRYVIDDEEVIALDFFAGSGSFGHAVMEANKTSNQPIRYILVQLPEPNDRGDKTAKAALKLGYKTIADLARERLRRGANEIAETENSTDTGFRAFRLTRSTFARWDATTEDTAEELQYKLEQHAQHLDTDASDEDILFELLLKDGFELTTKVERLDIPDGTVHSIADGALLICLERSLTRAMIDALADLAEANDAARVVCLDAGFDGNDELKTNAVQTFKSRMGEGADPHLFRTV